MSITNYACADEPAHVFAYHADCLTFLRQLPDDWTHAIICDPPYGLADHKAGVVADAITAWASGDRERVPNGKGFMGRAWDAFVPPPAVWDECLRVLKPGGHLAVFAGSRTVDLMGLSIRLAGFEMRDEIAAWIYSQGMPKAKGVLKGAHEPILLARKPFRGSETACRAEHGTGGLFVDECRVGEDNAAIRVRPASTDLGVMNDDAWRPKEVEQRSYPDGTGGRWPTNVVLAHHPDCGPDEAPGPCVPGCQVAALDEQSGTLTSGANPTRRGSDKFRNAYGDFGGQRECVAHRGIDSGGASRFFPTFRYQAKAPKVERPLVHAHSCRCEDPWPTSPARDTADTGTADSSSTSRSGSDTTDGASLTGTTSITSTSTSSTTTRPTSCSSTSSRTSASTPGASSATESGGSPADSVASSSPSAPSTGTSPGRAGRSTGGAGRATSHAWSATSVCGSCDAPSRLKGHETVKPLGLMRWLVRLLVPGPDGNGEVGCVLDPFAGSGATLEAARLEGRRAVGIERDEHSARLIAQRLGVEFREPPAKVELESTPTEVLLAKVAVAESVDALMDLYHQAVADELWCDEVKASFTARRVELEGVAA